MNSKRFLSLFLILCLLFSLVGCAKEEPTDSVDSSSVQESKEDSEQESETQTKTVSVDWNIDLTQVPDGWTKPHIWRLTVNPGVWKSEKLWSAEMDAFGSTKENSTKKLSDTAAEYVNRIFIKAEKVWNTGVKQMEYTVESMYNTASQQYTEFLTPLVIRSEDTWVMGVHATATADGTIEVRNQIIYEPTENETAVIKNWNFEGQYQWVWKLDGDYLYAMTYVEYAYARLVLGGDEDPFTYEWVPAPEAEVAADPDAADNAPEGTYYFEPLQGYLTNDATVYTYEGTEDTTDRGAAYTLLIQYMDYLCSTPCEEGMPYGHQITKYRNILSLSMVDRFEGIEGVSLVDVADDSYSTWDWLEEDDGFRKMDYGITRLAKISNVWILRFAFEYLDGDYADTENGYWSNVSLTTVMVKDGNTYYMLRTKDIAA
jgi:hypothetical protein